MHPLNICNSCNQIVCGYRKSDKDFTVRDGGCGSPVEWTPHKRSSCSFCAEFSQVGRPKEKDKRNPLTVSVNAKCPKLHFGK